MQKIEKKNRQEVVFSTAARGRVYHCCNLHLHHHSMRWRLHSRTISFESSSFVRFWEKWVRGILVWIWNSMWSIYDDARQNCEAMVHFFFSAWTKILDLLTCHRVTPQRKTLFGELDAAASDCRTDWRFNQTKPTPCRQPTICDDF